MLYVPEGPVAIIFLVVISPLNVPPRTDYHVDLLGPVAPWGPWSTWHLSVLGDLSHPGPVAPVAPTLPVSALFVLGHQLGPTGPWGPVAPWGHGHQLHPFVL